MFRRNLIKFGKYSTNILRKRSSTYEKFWKWTTQQRANWKEDKKEALLAIVVFGITGTSSVILVRPTIKEVFGLEGSLINGPNSYRVMSLLFISPIYALMLTFFGTLTGRHNYFAKMGLRIFGRFLPKALVDKILCRPAKIKKNIG